MFCFGSIHDTRRLLCSAFCSVFCSVLCSACIRAFRAGPFLYTKKFARLRSSFKALIHAEQSTEQNTQQNTEQNTKQNTKHQHTRTRNTEQNAKQNTNLIPKHSAKHLDITCFNFAYVSISENLQKPIPSPFFTESTFLWAHCFRG